MFRNNYHFVVMTIFYLYPIHRNNRNSFHSFMLYHSDSTLRQRTTAFRIIKTVSLICTEYTTRNPVPREYRMPNFTSILLFFFLMISRASEAQPKARRASPMMPVSAISSKRGQGF